VRLFDISRQIQTDRPAAEAEASALAEARGYLRDPPRTGDPTILLDGDLYLRIEEAPFVLYLRESDSHVVARLEARQLSLPEQAKEKARAFLRDVADRAARKNR
jgi:hypothetical protein